MGHIDNDTAVADRNSNEVAEGPEKYQAEAALNRHSDAAVQRNRIHQAEAHRTDDTSQVVAADHVALEPLLHSAAAVLAAVVTSSVACVVVVLFAGA